MELYFAIPGTGRILHTMNIRYFPEQLIYTIDHAEDEAIFVDRSLLPLLAGHLRELHTVQHVIVMDDVADPRSRTTRGSGTHEADRGRRPGRP